MNQEDINKLLKQYDMAPKKEAETRPPKKPRFMIIIVLIFFISLGLGIFFSGRYKKLNDKKNPAPSIAPKAENVKTTPSEKKAITPSITPVVDTKTIFSLKPESGTFTIGEKFDVEVIMTGLPVTAADISLRYDPEQIDVLELKNGTVFKRMIRKTTDNGVVQYSASINPEEKDNLALGTVFTISVVAKSKTAPLVLRFDRGATIAALKGQNTVGEPIDGSYRVN